MVLGWLSTVASKMGQQPHEDPLDTYSLVPDVRRYVSVHN